MITKNILEMAFFKKTEQIFLLREEIFSCCIGHIGNKKNRDTCIKTANILLQQTAQKSKTKNIFGTLTTFFFKKSFLNLFTIFERQAYIFKSSIFSFFFNQRCPMSRKNSL
jgi:hypothetical protein